jgi:hypothetical protein
MKIEGSYTRKRDGIVIETFARVTRIRAPPPLLPTP